MQSGWRAYVTPPPPTPAPPQCPTPCPHDFFKIKDAIASLLLSTSAAYDVVGPTFAVRSLPSSAPYVLSPSHWKHMNQCIWKKLCDRVFHICSLDWIPEESRQAHKDGERETRKWRWRERGDKVLTPPIFPIFLTHFSITSQAKAEKAEAQPLLQAAILNQRQIWSAASH